MTSPCKTSIPGAPLVSIITPAYNCADYLGETIESVLAQTFTNWELLIIDDGSETDEIRKIAGKYCQHDTRIHYAYKSHAGTGAARNHGIALAKGKYLGFLDSDDRYRPQGLATMVRALESSAENVKLVYGDFYKYFETEKRFQPTRATPPQPRPGLYFQFLIPGGNPVVPSASLLERTALDQTGCFDIQYLTIEDRQLWSRLVRVYDIFHIPEPVTIYRKHERQKTHKRNRAKRRFANDQHAYTFFFSMPLETWFPDATSETAQAIALDQLAKILLKKTQTPFDTALHMLHIAQKKNPSQNRQSFINRLEKKIPRILKKLYGSSERILIHEV